MVSNGCSIYSDEWWVTEIEWWKLSDEKKQTEQGLNGFFFFFAEKLVNGFGWVCWLTMYLKQVHENISAYGDLSCDFVGLF